MPLLGKAKPVQQKVPSPPQTSVCHSVDRGAPWGGDTEEAAPEIIPLKAQFLGHLGREEI